MPARAITRALAAAALALGATASPATAVTGPATADFGEVKVGEPATSLVLTMVAEHSGPGEALGTAAIVGRDAADFAITADTCSGHTIAAACRVTVAMAPAADGVNQATLHLPGAAGDATVALSGTGYAIGRRLRAEPGTVRLARSALPGTGTVDIVNDGDLPARLLPTVIVGGNAADFAITSPGCSGALLAPGARCTVALRYDPRGIDGREAELVATCDPTCGELRVRLAGDPAPPPSTTPPNYDPNISWSLAIKSARASGRAVIVRIRSSLPARFTVRVLRGKRTLARTGVKKLVPANFTVSLRTGGKCRRRGCKVQLAAESAAGKRLLGRPVRR